MRKLRSKKCRKKKSQETLYGLQKNTALMGIIMVQKPDKYDNGSKNDNGTVCTMKKASARAELEKETACEQYRKLYERNDQTNTSSNGWQCCVHCRMQHQIVVKRLNDLHVFHSFIIPQFEILFFFFVKQIPYKNPLIDWRVEPIWVQKRCLHSKLHELCSVATGCNQFQSN